MHTREPHPRVTEMIESGQLRLPADVAPEDVGYMELQPLADPAPPETLAGRGVLHLTGCMIEPQRRDALTGRRFVSLLAQLMTMPMPDYRAVAPVTCYRHCGRRRCSGCDQLFLGIFPTRALQRAANALTPAERRARRAERRRRLRRLRHPA